MLSAQSIFRMAVLVTSAAAIVACSNSDKDSRNDEKDKKVTQKSTTNKEVAALLQPMNPSEELVQDNEVRESVRGISVRFTEESNSVHVKIFFADATKQYVATYDPKLARTSGLFLGEIDAQGNYLGDNYDQTHGVGLRFSEDYSKLGVIVLNSNQKVAGFMFKKEGEGYVPAMDLNGNPFFSVEQLEKRDGEIMATEQSNRNALKPREQQTAEASHQARINL